MGFLFLYLLFYGTPFTCQMYPRENENNEKKTCLLEINVFFPHKYDKKLKTLKQKAIDIAST